MIAIFKSNLIVNATKTTLMCKIKPYVFKANPNHPILSWKSLRPLLYTRAVAKPTVPIPSPHSRSRYTRHNRYTWNALLLVRPEHAPVPPPKREVLETGPGHNRTHPPAHTAGRHCGVLRREVRPTVGVEGADVVGAIHVSGWMYVSLGVISFLVCVCIRERGRAREIEREGERERDTYPSQT